MRSKKLHVYWLMSLCALLLIMAGCSDNTSGSTEGNGSSEGEETYTIKLPTVVNEDNFVATTFMEFKDLVEEKSNGQIEVDIYLGGTLSSSDEENLQQLMDGTAQLIGMGPFVASQIGGVDGFNLFDVPFLFESREQLYELAEGPIGEQFSEEFLEATGTRILGYYDIGFLSILNSSHSITEPEDMNGLSIRTPQASLLMDTIEVMGGNPTPITFAEVYTSLQQGTIDGLTTTIPLMYDSQFYEVSKYLSITEHVLFPYLLIINNEFFESLPADLQEVVLEAADETVQFARELAIEQEESALENMKEEGVEVNELTPEQIETFREAVQPAIDNNIDVVGEDVFNQALEELNQ
ncbi:TRAP transporter substrate-binding protein [Desertibacillus haloalkaliphilus]|uniref:TRAP transporter substrate-binding protein n=1 Tax=Desertibacillus haloalkaliphilus TaxID=1328930 RepID=UPI001C258187|nr:TRAP transporter substrate-binding protein [Desertibacillus haloalkaliphilus]MBU8906259.1 TRAP transporter substrate-binding protein [Desertibacillus haloalkaliphilus]